MGAFYIFPVADLDGRNIKISTNRPLLAYVGIKSKRAHLPPPSRAFARYLTFTRKNGSNAPGLSSWSDKKSLLWGH